MDATLFGLFALAYSSVLLWGIIKHTKTASVILFVVVLSLIYDNVVLAFGNVMGEGTLLKGLTYGRFWMHALFTPTLILFSYFILKEAKLPIAYKKWTKTLFVLLTVTAIMMEIILNTIGLHFEIQKEYGVLSYTSTEHTAPVMIILVTGALLFTAITLGWKRKWWWMLVGVIIMSIGSVLPLEIGSNALTNVLELFLICMLMLTAIKYSSESKK